MAETILLHLRIGGHEEIRKSVTIRGVRWYIMMLEFVGRESIIMCVAGAMTKDTKFCGDGEMLEFVGREGIIMCRGREDDESLWRWGVRWS